MATIQGYLVVRADGDLRCTKRRPLLRWDEFAFPVAVTIPSTWGQVLANRIEAQLPAPDQPEVTIGDPENEER